MQSLGSCARRGSQLNLGVRRQPSFGRRMERPFERVYTVMDFYDGPRSGFADFGGAPHAYRSIWREDLDDWDPDDRFELSPVAGETLALALEDWAIWRRWEEAFYAGETVDTT